MKYRLLKDLPDLKAWAIFEQWNTEETVVNGRYSFYPVGAYESRFESINERGNELSFDGFIFVQHQP